MLLPNLFAFIILIIYVVTEADCHQDIYWRDYNGTIPHDAIAGGVDLFGAPTYVGQAYISSEDQAIPVNLHQNRTTAEVPHHGVHEVSNSLRILCSGHKDYFSWVKVTESTIPEYLPQLVIGSYGGKCYYIGRTLFKDEVIVGKVLCSYIKIYFAYKGKEEIGSAFEMLAYSESYAIRAYCRDQKQICPKYDILHCA